MPGRQLKAGGGTASTEFASPAAASAEFQSAELLLAPGLSDPAGMARNTVESAMDNQPLPTARCGACSCYEAFFATGDQVPGWQGRHRAGGRLRRHQRQAHPGHFGGQAHPAIFSDCPDGMLLLTLARPAGEADGATGPPEATVYAVVQFEYLSRNQAGDMRRHLPSPIAVLTPGARLANQPLRWCVLLQCGHRAPVHGLWVTQGQPARGTRTCPARNTSPTPHRARLAAVPGVQPPPVWRCARRANPYHWPSGRSGRCTRLPGSIKKHYCMGRICMNWCRSCLDQRTALMGATPPTAACSCSWSSQGGPVGHYFSMQTSGVGPGAAVLLMAGHATSAEVKEMATSAADIMDAHGRP